MHDSRRADPARGLRDLVPWADPYIAALIEKLRRSTESELYDVRDELPPPLGSDTPEQDPAWPSKWSPGSRPHE